MEGQYSPDVVKELFDAIHPIDGTAWKETIPLLKIRKLKKGQILTPEGEVFEEEGLIAGGLIRTFALDTKGQDYTLDFYMEGQFLGPYFSRTFERKSLVGIQALENSTVVLLDTESFSALRYKYTSLRLLGYKVVENELYRKTTKEIEMATLTAGERYERFRHKYPGLENRISQSLVASYLGVSPVSLSRLRGNKR